MIRCVVELYGLPRQITELPEVEVELKDGVSLREVVAALKREIPALEGRVTRAGEDRLLEYYAFNVNGCFYFDDGEVRLRDGDHVRLLTLAGGG